MRKTLGILLAVCAASCSSSPHKIRLGIAAQQSISQVPIYLAAQLGLYEQANLHVELAEFPGASKGMEALAGGSIDVLSGYYTQALQMRAQGKQFDVFLPVYDSLLVALAVSPASPERIQRIEDLRGKKVGVTTLGSATHQFLEYLLRKNGIASADVTPIAIGTAARSAAAMERGLVDAGVVTDFTIRHLERRFGNIVLLADTRTREGTRLAHGVSAFPGTVLMASPRWLDSNIGSAANLAAAVRTAMAWMREHTAEEITAKMPATHYGDDTEAYLAAIRYAIPMLSQFEIEPGAHQSAVEFLGLPAGTPPTLRKVLPAGR